MRMMIWNNIAGPSPKSNPKRWKCGDSSILPFWRYRCAGFTGKSRMWCSLTITWMGATACTPEEILKKFPFRHHTRFPFLLWRKLSNAVSYKDYLSNGSVHIMLFSNDWLWWIPEQWLEPLSWKNDIKDFGCSSVPPRRGPQRSRLFFLCPHHFIYYNTSSS